MRELEFYFKGRMRAANSVFNEARIVAQLRKTRDMQIQAQLALGDGVRGGGTRARHVTVTEERICGVCHKRLGGSVINVFPEYVPFPYPLRHGTEQCSPVQSSASSANQSSLPATPSYTSAVRIEFPAFGGRWSVVFVIWLVWFRLFFLIPSSLAFYSPHVQASSSTSSSP